MGKMLEALLRLQSVETQLATVRGRLRSRKNAVLAQQAKLVQLTASHAALHEKYLSRRKDGDRASLDLKAREDQVAKLRMSLNSAKTNKEYAAVLTQINTLKADNARLEEEALKILQDADTIKAQADEVDQADRGREGPPRRGAADQRRRGRPPDGHAARAQGPTRGGRQGGARPGPGCLRSHRR